MRKKPTIVALVFLAFTAGVWFVSNQFVYLDGEGKVGDTKSELLTLGKAVQVASQAEPIAPADWDRINDMSMLAPHITRLIEQGEQVLIDPWRNQFSLEKRVQGNQIIVTIRSSHPIKSGTLGIGMMVSRSDGTVSPVMRLWDD